MNCRRGSTAWVNPSFLPLLLLRYVQPCTGEAWIVRALTWTCALREALNNPQLKMTVAGSGERWSQPKHALDWLTLPITCC